MATTQNWLVWALLSAAFAALTAIFAKLGLKGVDSDYATLVRTAVIIISLGAFVWATGKWQNPAALSGRTLAFLVLSGLATGCLMGLLLSGTQGWGGITSRPGRQAERRPSGALCRRLSRRASSPARLARHPDGGSRRPAARTEALAAQRRKDDVAHISTKGVGA